MNEQSSPFTRVIAARLRSLKKRLQPVEDSDTENRVDGFRLTVNPDMPISYIFV